VLFSIVLYKYILVTFMYNDCVLYGMLIVTSHIVLLPFICCPVIMLSLLLCDSYSEICYTIFLKRPRTKMWLTRVVYPGVNYSSINVTLVHVVMIMLKFTMIPVATILTACCYCEHFVEPYVGPGSSRIAPIRFQARWPREPINQGPDFQKILGKILSLA